MTRPRKDDEPRRRRPPATTRAARENQLIALTEDLVEKSLLDGTASAQVQVHFLKLATVREEMERDKIKAENALLKARVENLASSVNSEQLYKDAIAAFTSYRPEETPEDFVE